MVFEVPNAYQESLDELLKNGKVTASQDMQKNALDTLIANANWEETEEYGFYTYTAIIENTSEYDYSNVSLNVYFYDADGIKTESAANVSSWKKGEKAKFETYAGEVKAASVEAEVIFYEASE